MRNGGQSGGRAKRRAPDLAKKAHLQYRHSPLLEDRTGETYDTQRAFRAHLSEFGIFWRALSDGEHSRQFGEEIRAVVCRFDEAHEATARSND
jgi:hypothetical protein